MARKNSYDGVLKQIAANQQQAAADAERQRIAEHNQAVSNHYDTLSFLLSVQHAAEDAALRAHWAGQGESGL